MLPAVVICGVLHLGTSYGSPISDIIVSENVHKSIPVKGAPTCDLKTDDMGWSIHYVTKLRVTGPEWIQVLQVKSDDIHIEGLLRLKQIKAECAVRSYYFFITYKTIISVNIGSMDIEVRYRNHSGNLDPQIQVINMNDVSTSAMPMHMAGARSRAEETIMDSGTNVQRIIAAIVNGALGDHSSPLCL